MKLFGRVFLTLSFLAIVFYGYAIIGMESRINFAEGQAKLDHKILDRLYFKGEIISARETLIKLREAL